MINVGGKNVNKQVTELKEDVVDIVYLLNDIEDNENITTKLINAITNVPNNQKLKIKAGTYLISDRITLKNYTKIDALGVTLKPTATFKTTASTTSTGFYTVLDMTKHTDNTDLRHVEIYGLTIDCSNDSTIDYGIYTSGTNRNFDLQHVTVTNAKNGFFFQSIFVSNIIRCEALICSNTGFRISGTSTKVTSCYAISCAVGYLVDQLQYGDLNSCASDFCTKGYVVTLSSMNLINCGCERTDWPLDINSTTGIISGGFYMATDNPVVPVTYLVVIQGRSYLTVENIALINGAGVTSKKITSSTTIGDSAVYITGCKGFTANDVIGNEQLRFQDHVRMYSFYTSNFNNVFLQLPHTASNNSETKLAAGGVYYFDTSNKFRVCNGTSWFDIATKTTGTTANRPTKPQQGHEHFDTTLNKPIWCKTVAVVDGGGNVTTPAVWIDSGGTIV